MTSTLTHSSSELTIRLNYEVSGKPDRPMFGTTVYRPGSVEIVLYTRNATGTRPNRANLHISNLKIHGHRVRKDGSLGADHREWFYGSGAIGLPDWAQALLSKAIREQTAPEGGW